MDLVKVKKLKGKQNKKKWRKNVDVSELLEHIAKTDNLRIQQQSLKPLIVEDTSLSKTQPLHPDRFKNRPRSQIKPKYERNEVRQNLLEGQLQDVWGDNVDNTNEKAITNKIPAVIKPASGHSYNPRLTDIEQIVDEVVDYEQQKPRRQFKAKKVTEVKSQFKTKDAKIRKQYEQAQERKRQRLNQSQIHNIKRIDHELQREFAVVQHKIKEKQSKAVKRELENRTGKVREAPRLGKKIYKYRQYIPDQTQLRQKMSQISLNDELARERYDSIFRRGILEPKNVQNTRKKKRKIKIVQRFREQ